MIQDLDKALGTILESALVNVTVSFARPDGTFAPGSNTLNLFLYDIRENVTLRNNEPTVERVNGQVKITRPPRRYDCSYLVTAWPVGAFPDFTEHRLLGEALRVLGRTLTIPNNLIAGSELEPQDPLVPLTAPHGDLLQSVGEFWSAMNNRIRASFTVTATISVPVYPDVNDPMVTAIFGDHYPDSGAPPDSLLKVGGRVLTTNLANERVPVPGAVVDVINPRRTTRSDTDGRFVFSRLPAGDLEYRVVAVGFNVFNQTLTTPGPAQGIEIELTPL